MASLRHVLVPGLNWLPWSKASSSGLPPRRPCRWPYRPTPPPAMAPTPYPSRIVGRGPSFSSTCLTMTSCAALAVMTEWSPFRRSKTQPSSRPSCPTSTCPPPCRRHVRPGAHRSRCSISTRHKTMSSLTFPSMPSLPRCVLERDVRPTTTPFSLNLANHLYPIQPTFRLL